MSSDLWAAFGTDDAQPAALPKPNPPRPANVLFDQETEQDEVDEFGDFEEGEDDFGDFEEAEDYMASPTAISHSQVNPPVIGKAQANPTIIRTQPAASVPNTLPSADLSLSELAAVIIADARAYTHTID